jgi:hypothetical protein
MLFLGTYMRCQYVYTWRHHCIEVLVHWLYPWCSACCQFTRLPSPHSWTAQLRFLMMLARPIRL